MEKEILDWILKGGGVTGAAFVGKWLLERFGKKQDAAAALADKVTQLAKDIVENHMRELREECSRLRDEVSRLRTRVDELELENDQLRRRTLCAQCGLFRAE